MLVGWNKDSRRSCLPCSPVPNSIAISWARTRGTPIRSPGKSPIGRTVRRSWSSSNIYWWSAIQPGASFWWWTMFPIIKALRSKRPWACLNIVSWSSGCLRIVRNWTWLNDFGNIWKHWLVSTNFTTAWKRSSLQRNTSFHSKTIRPAICDSPFLKTYERLLRRNDIDIVCLPLVSLIS